MPSGPRKIALPFESAHDLVGFVHRAPYDIASITGRDLQMAYFPQEFPNVLGRASRDDLARSKDHGTQITEIPCPRNCTPNNPTQGERNTTAPVSGQTLSENASHQFFKLDRRAPDVPCLTLMDL